MSTYARGAAAVAGAGRARALEMVRLTFLYNGRRARLTAVPGPVQSVRAADLIVCGTPSSGNKKTLSAIVSSISFVNGVSILCFGDTVFSGQHCYIGITRIKS
ncbi:hypothetical protein EVAR_29223_1 [Eumeta japonica]|uniref:Uncharacterized protein n=1 Tax=Eumeta variegata TaxID=151549 RepID=A0A4C1VI68_EUMVA|nr:hypothetical protein EVAR_29223_1 [Eumeta japonica]